MTVFLEAEFETKNSEKLLVRSVVVTADKSQQQSSQPDCAQQFVWTRLQSPRIASTGYAFAAIRDDGSVVTWGRRLCSSCE